MRVVIAIDPGREKCGLAVVSEGGVLQRSVLSPEEIPGAVGEMIAVHSPEVIVIGDGTHAGALAGRIREHAPRPPVVFADESYTTLRARERFFRENPPRGLRRLIPRGMLIPGRPIDDLAAVILGEDYLAGNQHPHHAPTAEAPSGPDCR